MATLYDKLQLAVKYNIHPGDINILIEEKPVIDTVNEKDKNALLAANINITDESNISAGQVKNAWRTIYWKTGDEKYAVKIMGIAWMHNKTIHFFGGEILTP